MKIQFKVVLLRLFALLMTILFGLGTYDYLMEPIGNEGRISGLIKMSFAFFVSLYYLINGRFFSLLPEIGPLFSKKSVKKKDVE